ncbi:MAG: sodium:alanine symporter family protein [Ruminococcus sp.]|nr:sodium:alanine symporter family protein [Ruminococcus sp.]
MNTFFTTLNSYLWGFPMIAFLLFTHLFFTFKTGFVQKKLFTGIKLSFEGSGECGKNISPFQTLCTTLASTLGTGNIIGIGAAISLGGAGSLFWCLVTGFLGIATMYSESLLSLKYRVKNKDGHFVGGPMYYMSRGMSSKWLGVFYAVAASLGGLITGAMLQGNAVSTAVHGFFRIEKPESAIELNFVTVTVGVIAAVLTALVIMGGVKSVGSVCQVLVPFMAIAYMLACVGIIIVNRAYLGEALSLIITSAFSKKAAFGGFVGSTVMTACRFGMARGLFSNEAGVGTTSVVSAAAEGDNHKNLSYIAMTAAFWDTAVVCMMTGLAIVSAMLANPAEALKTDGDLLANLAFDTLPYVGRPVLFFGLITFAFSTIIGWSYIGERCIEFVLGFRGVKLYRVLWVAAVLVAASVNSELVWSIADTVNVLLVVPNTAALFVLKKEIE